MKKNTLLEVKNLSKRFKGKDILLNVDFNLFNSDILFLMGKNGSGKTTLIKIIAGIILQNSGNVTLKLDSQNKLNNIGYISSNDRSFFLRLTAFENLKYFLMMRDLSHKESTILINNFAEKIKLPESILNKKVMDLSSGEKKKLSIMRAFMHKPRLLLLDEPTDSLDTETKSFFLDLLKDEINDSAGRACIISSHSVRDCLKIASRCLILEDKSSKIVLRKNFKDNEYLMA